MTASAPLPRPAETTPRAKARLAGVFAILTILLAMVAQGYISDRLVVPQDAAATATNILAHASLYQLAFSVYLVEMICQITMMALFYELLRPAGRSVSLLALVIGVVGCGIKTFSRLFFFAPLLVLGDNPWLNVFDAPQRQALALLFFKVNDHGAAIAMVFFGVYALLRGYLILRSTFLPKILGVLAGLGGLGWVAYVWPPLGYGLFPIIAGVALIGSAANIFWLIVYGVNEQRWREQALAGESTIWR